MPLEDEGKERADELPLRGLAMWAQEVMRSCRQQGLPGDPPRFLPALPSL